ILEMHIVITGSVDHEEIALQTCCMCEWRIIVVTRGVQLRCLQKTLRIYCIVKSPVGNRCHSNTGFENTACLRHCKGGHVATIAPAPDPKTLFVNIWKGREIFCSCDQVLKFILAQLFVCHLFESSASRSRTACINDRNEKSLLREKLVKEIVTACPGVACILRTGSAILIKHNRILSRFRK